MICSECGGKAIMVFKWTRYNMISFVCEECAKICTEEDNRIYL